MAVTVVGVAVVAATICSSRVADNVGGSLWATRGDDDKGGWGATMIVPSLCGVTRQKSSDCLISRSWEVFSRSARQPTAQVRLYGTTHSKTHRPHPEVNNDNPVPTMTTTRRQRQQRRLGKLKGNGDDERCDDRPVWGDSHNLRRRSDEDDHCDGGDGDDSGDGRSHRDDKGAKGGGGDDEATKAAAAAATTMETRMTMTIMTMTRST
ncbi:hypothetical protein EDB85DRAFT_2227430 [Lactarius pseudohatsudake]|nr:hypothetical protein EDB85DRAFT_2227430 [Lactarius pseudohatsudake]